MAESSAQNTGRVQAAGPPRRDADQHMAPDNPAHESVTRTVFISRIPTNGITDDVLYADFSEYGRVLATKVFVPKSKYQGKPDKAVQLGAFIEFATAEVAEHVMNTVKAYRGIETEVKWGRRSLVESIKEQQQRQTGGDAARGREDQVSETSASVHDDRVNGKSGGNVGSFALYGTLYGDACEVVDYKDQIGSFIQEQAQLWHQELQAYYSSMMVPTTMGPPAGPVTAFPTGPVGHVSNAHIPVANPGQLPPHVHMAAPMLHHTIPRVPAIPTMSGVHHPAGMPITPLPPQMAYSVLSLY